jgi:probable rRNA maturation factor
MLKRNKIVLQKISQCIIPSRYYLKRWVNHVLIGRSPPTEVVIRVVDEAESAFWNKKYRHQSGPTNVLSFRFDAEIELDDLILGDLLVCAPLVAREAQEQEKSLHAHWAHLVIHGTLHLLGYDHVHRKEAQQMEALEIKLLDALGFENPYN